MFFMRNEAISFELLIFFCGTLEGFHGTLGFRGTQFEDHCNRPFPVKLFTIFLITNL